MTILLRPNTVPSTALPGTVVGTLTDTRFSATTYTTLFAPPGFLGVVQSRVVTRWTAPPQPGVYTLYLLAFASWLQFEIGWVTVVVTAPAAPRPAYIGLDLRHPHTEPQPVPGERGP